MLNPLKLLLLGCGDIGSRVISQIDRQLWSVAAMRRQAGKLPVGVDAFAGDIGDPEQLGNVLEQTRPDAVAVTLTPGEMSDAGYRNSYVKGARVLRKVLESMSVSPQILWISSTAVYGQNSGEWVDEQSPTEPAGYRGHRLLEAEQLLLQSSLPVSVVRFSGIYGPGRERLLNNIRAGKLASPDQPQWGNRIHSDDCAGVLVHLLDKFRQGARLEDIYLATDSEPALAHIMQRELAVQLGVDVSEVETVADAKPAGRRCSNQRLRECGYVFRYPTWQEGYAALLGNL